MPDLSIVRMDLPVFLDLLPFHPYDDPPWAGCTPITVAEVLSCGDPNPGRLVTDVFRSFPRHLHVARTAWLVQNWPNNGSDPIDVEVFRGVIVHDGCHRLAAAVARRDEHIFMEIGGDLDEAADLGFPVGPILSTFAA